jgi:hypothetical protein
MTLAMKTFLRRVGQLKSLGCLEHLNYRKLVRESLLCLINMKVVNLAIKLNWVEGSAYVGLKGFLIRT